jgi:GNAT superfamily N-acetyltransferase
MVAIRDVMNPNWPWFRQAMRIYEAAFPPEQRVPTEDMAAALERQPDDATGAGYFLVALDGVRVVGLSTFHYGYRHKLGFLGYLAVEERWRGRGIGALLYKATLARLQWCGQAGEGEGLDGMVFEVERPELAADPLERQRREQLIRFFTRMGARLVRGIDYRMPPILPYTEPVPMHLMLHPLSAEPFTDGYLRRVMAHIYGDEGDGPAEHAALYRSILDSIEPGHVALSP